MLTLRSVPCASGSGFPAGDAELQRAADAALAVTVRAVGAVGLVANPRKKRHRCLATARRRVGDRPLRYGNKLSALGRVAY